MATPARQLPTQPQGTTARQAMKAFWKAEDLPADGNASAWIDWLPVFGIPMPVPNPAARVAVLPYHDLHHMVTGYHTDECGECEISAWTVATGGRQPWLGRVYDSLGLAWGLVRCPRRTIAAYRRGLASRNLYGRPVEELLDLTVDELRELSVS